MNKASTEENVEEEKQSSGMKLKTTREEKGYTLETIHEATKIPLDVLRAIEEGYTVRTLSPFYLKGFLKMYAKYLDVDINDIIEDYKPEELPELIKKDVDEVDFQLKLQEFLTREKKRQIVVVCGILLCLFALFKIVAFFVNWGSSRVKRSDIVQKAVPKAPVVNTRSVDLKEIKKPAEPVTQKVKQAK